MSYPEQPDNTGKAPEHRKAALMSQAGKAFNKPMKVKKLNAKETEKQEAIERLKGWLKPGDTLYTIPRHKSASGMSRRISVIQIEKNEPRWLDYNVAKALGWREKQDEGIIVGGAGMDMGFHLVYTLAQALFNDGYALKQRWL